MKNIISPFQAFFLDRTIPLDIIIFSLLIILLPIVLITGPALPDIFLSVIALYFLVKSVIYKKWSYYKNSIVIGFLLFSAYGIIRSLFYEVPWLSLYNEGSIFYFRYIFFALGVWYLLDHNPYLPKCLLYVSLICLSIVCLDGLYQYFLGTNILGNYKYSENRLTGFFGDEPIIGRYIAYLSIFTFALIYQNFQKTKTMMIFSVAFLVMTEIIVFLSGERAALLCIFLFSVLIVIFIPKFRIYRVIGLLISVISIYAILEINPTAKERMIDFTIDQVSQTHFPFLPYSAHHEEHYVSALKMFQNKSLFGIGTNNFRFECSKKEYIYKDRSCSSHPHNYYLQVLAELGLFGFFALVTFFLYLCFILLRQFYFVVKNDKKKLIPFGFFLYPVILFVYWWPLIPHMSFYNNWLNVFMMLPLGFFMRYLYSNNPHGNT